MYHTNPTDLLDLLSSGFSPGLVAVVVVVLAVAVVVVEERVESASVALVVSPGSGLDLSWLPVGAATVEVSGALSPTEVSIASLLGAFSPLLPDF